MNFEKNNVFVLGARMHCRKCYNEFFERYFARRSRLVRIDRSWRLVSQMMWTKTTFPTIS